MTTAPVFPPEAWQARLLCVLVWALAAAGFGVTGWMFGVRPIASTVQNWRLAQHYREVDASILTRTTRLADGGTDVAVAASYEVDGKPYVTVRLTPADDDAFDEPESAAVAKSLQSVARMNARTKVWVDAADPRAAVVSRAFPSEMVLRRASLAIAFPVLALMAAVGALGALGNFGYYRRFHKYNRGWVRTALFCAVAFSVRRLFSDAYLDIDDVFFDFTMIMELLGFIFIGASISVLFERDEASKEAVKIERVKRARKKD